MFVVCFPNRPVQPGAQLGCWNHWSKYVYSFAFHVLMIGGKQGAYHKIGILSTCSYIVTTEALPFSLCSEDLHFGEVFCCSFLSL